jgi:thymidylate kinase
MTPRVLCVEGTKGAGKTTTIAAVRERLIARGWAVEVFALFHAGNEWARAQGYEGGVPMMESAPDANRAMVTWLTGALRAERERFVTAHADGERPALLIFDRGWITLHAYLYEGAWARLAEARNEIDALWSAALVEAPPTFFIHTKPEVTSRRRAGALDAVSGLQTDARLQGDYERRMTLARAHSDRIVRAWETDDETFTDIAAEVIAWVQSGSQLSVQC